MPNTIGTRFPVRRPVLADGASIEEAYEMFYLGADADHGVEYYMSDHEDRIVDLEAAVASVGITTFSDAAFRVYKNGASASKIKFNLSALTTERTLTVKDADQELVGLALTQTMQNKTLDNTNEVNIKDSKFTVVAADGSGRNFRFSTANLPVATTVISMPTLAGADTLVCADVAQVVKKKTFAGYKETVTTSTSIDAAATNAVKLTVTGAATIAFDVSSVAAGTAYTCSLIIEGTANLVWSGTFKWVGGTVMSSNSGTSIVVVTYYDGVYYAANIGAFS